MNMSLLDRVLVEFTKKSILKGKWHKRYNLKLQNTNFRTIPRCEKILESYLALPNAPALGAWQSSTTVGPVYTISENKLYMPPMRIYESREFYHHEKFHEVAHSTGTADKLGRKRIKYATSKRRVSYLKLTEEDIFEEIIAELSALILSDLTGILTNKQFRRSILYLRDQLVDYAGVQKLAKIANYKLCNIQINELIPRLYPEAEKVVEYIINA